MSRPAEATLLTLTRRAVGAWKHWREADGEISRRHVIGYHGLAEAEVAALERLDANHAQCGPLYRYTDGVPDGLQDGVLDTLFTGLDPRHLPVERMVAALLPATYGESMALRSGFTAWVRAHRQIGAMMEDEREEEMDGKSEAEAAPLLVEAAPTRTGGRPSRRKLVAHAIEARGLNLSQSIPEAVKREIAAELGCEATTVSYWFTQLCREKGIEAPSILNGRERQASRNNSGTCRPADTVTCPEPEAGLPALLAALCLAVAEVGLQQIQPAEVREPLRRLVRSQWPH